MLVEPDVLGGLALLGPIPHLPLGGICLEKNFLFFFFLVMLPTHGTDPVRCHASLIGRIGLDLNHR